MDLSVYNFEWKQIQKMIECEIILNKNTMTEQLIFNSTVINSTVIYEAPICTCLSCFLNDRMDEMQILTKESIHVVIASILKIFGVTFDNSKQLSNDAYSDKISANDEITAKLLGLDNVDVLLAKLSDYKNTALYDAFHNANLIIEVLLAFERMFSFDTYWDDKDIKTQHEVLKDILSEYIANLNTDPLCKELSFFHHIFNNDAYYTVHDSSLLDIYYQNNSEMSPEFLFRHLRQTYISLHQGKSRYIVNSYQDICVMTLYFALQNNLTINKCKNCGNYFIPLSRSDEVYCDNPSPQNSQKTCKQYGKTTGSYEKNQRDPVLKMCRNLYNSKQMLVRRHPDITAYSENFERFKQDSEEWKRKYKSQKCTAEEFAQWIIEQKGKNT